MNQVSTPLGFLPGVIYSGSHCMLSYSRPDDSYILSVSKYMVAGIASGQMCICAVLQPHQMRIKQHLKSVGVSLASDQLLMPDAEHLYLPGGRFDTKHVAGYYIKNAAVAESKWNGMRVFGDISFALDSRAVRLKLLEYEALFNAQQHANVTALCGYQASVLPRGYVLQAKSVHPFIASSKSMRLNRSFVETDKFLSGLYRFRRMDREYPATLDQAEKIVSDVEETAIRTSMTLPDIDSMKEVVRSLFVNVVRGVASGIEKPHVHMVYAPKPDKFSVTLRCHRAMLGDANMDWKSAESVMDDIQVDRLSCDWVITMVRKY